MWSFIFIILGRSYRKCLLIRGFPFVTVCHEDLQGHQISSNDFFHCIFHVNRERRKIYLRCIILALLVLVTLASYSIMLGKNWEENTQQQLLKLLSILRISSISVSLLLKCAIKAANAHSEIQTWSKTAIINLTTNFVLPLYLNNECKFELLCVVVMYCTFLYVLGID